MLNVSSAKTNSNVEMHHIKGLKYLKGTTVQTEIMRKLNRIQVPLHHKMAHKNGLMTLIKENNLSEEGLDDHQDHLLQS